MTDRTDGQPNELDKANAVLRASLQQCRAMVADYRKKIAANANEPPGSTPKPTSSV